MKSMNQRIQGNDQHQFDPECYTGIAQAHPQENRIIPWRLPGRNRSAIARNLTAPLTQWTDEYLKLTEDFENPTDATLITTNSTIFLEDGVTFTNGNNATVISSQTAFVDYSNAYNPAQFNNWGQLSINGYTRIETLFNNVGSSVQVNNNAELILNGGGQWQDSQFQFDAGRLTLDYGGDRDTTFFLNTVTFQGRDLNIGARILADDMVRFDNVEMIKLGVFGSLEATKSGSYEFRDTDVFLANASTQAFAAKVRNIGGVFHQSAGNIGIGSIGQSARLELVSNAEYIIDFGFDAWPGFTALKPVGKGGILSFEASYLNQVNRGDAGIQVDLEMVDSEINILDTGHLYFEGNSQLDNVKINLTQSESALFFDSRGDGGTHRLNGIDLHNNQGTINFTGNHVFIERDLDIHGTASFAPYFSSLRFHRTETGNTIRNHDLLWFTAIDGGIPTETIFRGISLVNLEGGRIENDSIYGNEPYLEWTLNQAANIQNYGDFVLDGRDPYNDGIGFGTDDGSGFIQNHQTGVFQKMGLELVTFDVDFINEGQLKLEGGSTVFFEDYEQGNQGQLLIAEGAQFRSWKNLQIKGQVMAEGQLSVGQIANIETAQLHIGGESRTDNFEVLGEGEYRDTDQTQYLFEFSEENGSIQFDQLTFATDATTLTGQLQIQLTTTAQDLIQVGDRFELIRSESAINLGDGLGIVGNKLGNGITLEIRATQHSIDLVATASRSETLIEGTDNPDRLRGSTSDDWIYGYGDRDTLLGQGGDDWLIGGESRDILRGQMGDDTLRGGPGNDVLFGNQGSDIFGLTRFEGRDIIRDFIDGEDRLGLSNGLVFSDLGFRMTSTGHTIIQDINQNIDLAILHNVTMNSLSAADFTAIA